MWYKTSFLFETLISYLQTFAEAILLFGTCWFIGQPLQWCHNERDGVSNHQPHDCLLKRLFRRRSKKAPKLRVTGLCERYSPVTGEFSAQWPVTRKLFPFDDVIMLPPKTSYRKLYHKINTALAMEILQSCTKPSIWSYLLTSVHCVCLPKSRQTTPNTYILQTEVSMTVKNRV